MANGFFGGGDGTVSSPFLIEDADDLNAIRNYKTQCKCFALVNDINMANGKYNSGLGWTPIPWFGGLLDGRNHRIFNLTINRPKEDMIGLFKSCSGILKDLIFVDADVTGRNNVGVIAGIYENIMTETSEWLSGHSANLRSIANSTVGNCFVKNVHIVNSKITANARAAGMFGSFWFFASGDAVTDSLNRGYSNWGNNGWTVRTQYNGIFNSSVEIEISSQDGIATGFLSGVWADVNALSSYLGDLRLTTLNRWYSKQNCSNNCNCTGSNCNCVSHTSTQYLSIGTYGVVRGGQCLFLADNSMDVNNSTNPNRVIYLQNCFTKFKKNPTITTYWAFVKSQFNDGYCVNNYTNMGSYAGANSTVDLDSVTYSTNLLPNLNKEVFEVVPDHRVEPLNLTNDSIYFYFDNAYHVYDFSENKFVVKYTILKDENSKKIVQDGMSKEQLNKIPNSKLQELKDKYGKIKVVNCLSAHKKIVYKSSNLTMQPETQKNTSKTKIFKQKVDLKNFNEVVQIAKKQG